MSIKKQLYVPPNFITTEKYYQNRTSIISKITDIKGYNLKKWFYESENIKYLTKILYHAYMANDYKYAKNDKKNYKYFEDNILEWMSEFSQDNDDFNQYSEEPKTAREKYKYYINSLSLINKEFLDTYYYVSNIDLDDMPHFNPYRSSVYIGSKNEFTNDVRNISLHDLAYSVEDCRNIDLWEKHNVIRKNNHYRYNNQIPIWQHLNKNRRGYDRSNDGLQDADACRASLETIQRGYDMSDVFKYATSLQYNLDNKQNLYP